MFKIFHIRQTIARIFRAIDIAFIMLKYLLINWMSTHRLLFGFIPRRYKRDKLIISQAERLRTVIEDLGPTFIKFGQILADRPDVVSEKLGEELKKLQNTAEPFDHERAIILIEEELGGSIKTLFRSFDSNCIGSASLGQVYKGVLHNGDEVVVKIQRPDIKPKIELDLQILKYFAEQLIKEYPGFAVMDLVGVLDEFEDALLKELNYLNEAGNAIRFYEMFKEVEYCKIPRVYMDMTTDKLLVMELVTGVIPSNKEELIANGLSPNAVAENGMTILLEMIFKYGFFHADPHPGNMFIQAGNRIALIDFGMTGTLKPAHMHFLAGFTLGLATRNAGTVTDALLTLCGKKFFAEKNDLEFLVSDMLKRFGSLSYEKTNFSQLLNESVKIIQKYDLQLPGSIYLLAKALATLEKVGYNLDAEISLPVLIRPYAEHLIKEKFSPKQIAGEVFDTVKDYVSLIRDFPNEINEILYNLKKGKIVVDINLKNPESAVKSIKQMGSMIVSIFILAVMMAVCVILIVKDKETPAVHFLFGVSIFFSIWLLLRLFFRSKDA